MKHTPEEIIKSARTAIISILPLKIFPPHKNELLSVLIWKITEVDGKYNVRYYSKGALPLEKKSPQEKRKKKLIHEHVYKRKWLIDQLLMIKNYEPESVNTIIKKMVACLVTEKEHHQLKNIPDNLIGWERYKHAGIQVYDTEEKHWIT